MPEALLIKNSELMVADISRYIPRECEADWSTLEQRMQAVSSGSQGGQLTLFIWEVFLQNVFALETPGKVR